MKQAVAPMRGGTPQDPAVPAAMWPFILAAGLSLVTALIHLWLMPEHLARSWVRGSFFGTLALVQGAYGVALLRWPSRKVLALGAWGTLMILVLYAAERAYAASFGPHGGGHASGTEVFAMVCTAAGLGLLSAPLLGATRLLYAAEALTLGAALLHLWQAQERYAEWWGFGAFFAAIGLAQGLYCLALPRLAGRRLFLAAGIAGNLAVVALWVWTRTVGIPYVRTHGIAGSELRLGKTEGVGVLDLAATTMEMALVVMLAMLAAGLHHRGTSEAHQRTTGRR